MKRVYTGTCSWTDSTLIKESSFYPTPTMTAEERLKYYASVFPTVEVDSSFYALPSEAVVALQTARTPSDFILHYKAYGLLTGHSVETKALPKAICELIEPRLLDQRRLAFKDAHGDALKLAFQMFGSAMRPARDAGKLGVLLFQYPPWFEFSDDNLAYIGHCREELSSYRLAVEFRHPSWLDGANADRTFGFLENNNLAYVSVDEPQFDRPLTVPPVFRATTDLAYIRLHGRNKDAWFKKGISAAERFAYKYTQDELLDIAKYIRPLTETANHTFVMFNNCFRDYAVTNAMIMMEILRD
jgi:uncharacterized protein YecE (DUF72 family)